MAFKIDMSPFMFEFGVYQRESRFKILTWLRWPSRVRAH